MKTVVNILRANAPYKVLSFIIAYGFWICFHDQGQVTKIISVPVLVSSKSQHEIVQAPESIKVALSGKKSTLRSLDPKDLSITIDQTNLHEGINIVKVSSQDLLLPEDIKVINCEPAAVTTS